MYKAVLSLVEFWSVTHTSDIIRLVYFKNEYLKQDFYFAMTFILYKLHFIHSENYFFVE